MIRSGTTCFADGYFFEEEAARAVSRLGLRAILGQGVLDFPTPDVPNPDINLEKGEKYLEQFPSSSLITPALFCRSAYTCKSETLKKARAVCNKRPLPLLIHIAETESEVKEIMARILSWCSGNKKVSAYSTYPQSLGIKKEVFLLYSSYALPKRSNNSFSLKNLL